MQDPVLEIFREESREHLGALEKGFLDLEAAPSRALVDALFRHAHSLKGDAHAVGLPELQAAAQVLEDVLDAFRDHPEKLDRASIDQGLAQLDRVRSRFDAWQKSLGEAAPTEPAAATEVAAAPPLVSPAPPPEEAPLAPASEESFTVRVPAERLDRMLNTAGEVRIAQRAGAAIAARLTELRRHLEHLLKTGERQSPLDRRHALEAAVDQVRRAETDLRKNRGREELLLESLETDIRQARLLPLSMLTDSLRRAVRDLSQSLGKQIRYDVEVGNVLLDKAVLEALKDPLLHLIRNAADHGLESPDERRAARKPAEGVIRIRASRRGDLVRIAVADDGRGLSYADIRERVRRLGRQTDAEVNSLTEPELHAFLFQPGFTTASSGHVSGRGVGLDVVQNTLHRLQGNVEIESSSRAGTTFVLQVPVTISTLRILTVLSGGNYYGVPSSLVLRTGRARRHELRELEGGFVLPLDGAPVRWVHLSDLLGTSQVAASHAVEAWSYLLIAHDGRTEFLPFRTKSERSEFRSTAGGRMAVVVDDLEEEREVLLKPLGFPLGGLPGIVGGTIRPDGSVQIVLDLSSPAFGQVAATPRLPPAVKVPRILIVDDSPTTRAILRNVFTAAGYAVRTATDGIDALERLRHHPVDVIVTDFEMPRLNGVDLTRQVKGKYGLPVILVTAREKEEHRREGLAAGADAYVVKSTFQGQGLLEVVKQFV